jgi:hypothetical protein
LMVYQGVAEKVGAAAHFVRPKSHGIGVYSTNQFICILL